jgi:hypothetical protein
VLTLRIRSLLVCLVAAAGLGLALSDNASAGYGTYPNGQTFEVVTEGGYISSPRTLDFVVGLDGQDSQPYVWVSASPEIDGYGTPGGAIVGSCGPTQLIPFGEPGKWVCRDSTILLEAGHTYYWWLDFNRREPDDPYGSPQISGPFAFTLAEKAPTAPPTTVPETSPDVPTAPASTATVERAATLAAGERYTAGHSIKQARLTRLVYQTMKALGAPRQLAFACWSASDWSSVVESEGAAPEDDQITLLGFWASHQPRWLHLSPGTCLDVQGLLDTRLVNARRASALTTVIHETLHAYGVRNEAQTNCFAVQLVPFFGLSLRMPTARALYLGTLARNITRRRAPPGYWSSSSCRDGGRWDMLPGLRNLG